MLLHPTPRFCAPHPAGGSARGFSLVEILVVVVVMGILLALLVTSNDASLRKLGLPGWKSLQRWNYACFALTVFHTFGYLIGIESLEAAAIITASLCVVITAWLQWEGWRSRA